MSIYHLPEFKKPNILLPKIKKSSPTTEQPKRKRVKPSPPGNRFVSFLIISVFLAAFLGFVFGGLAVGYLNSNYQNSLLDSDLLEKLLLTKKEQPNETPQSTSNEETVVKVVKQVSPSVVSIIVTKDLPIMEKYYYNPFEEFEKYFGKGFGIQVPGYRQKGTEKKEVGGGTGFIVSSNGLILTNKHVVLDGEAEYSVLMNDGRRFDAKVIARDPVQDIAILKINDSGFLPAVKLGDSDQLEIGQTVIAIGNVLGEFRNSVSVGVISGLQRSITASGLGMSEVLEDTIQTDAAINKGNSGGPLLNLRGEVIGINTATALQAQNVGFAIPINKAKKDIYQVQEFGEIRYPFLGIYYTLVTSALQQEFDLGVDYGAWVGRDQNGQKTDQAIFPDSPAEKIGLQRDDIILEFGGEKITLENSLAKIIMKHNPGDKVVLKVLRQGEIKIFNVTLDKRSE